MEITGGVSRIAVLICDVNSGPTAEVSISRNGSGRDFGEGVSGRIELGADLSAGAGRPEGRPATKSPEALAPGSPPEIPAAAPAPPLYRLLFLLIQNHKTNIPLLTPVSRIIVRTPQIITHKLPLKPLNKILIIPHLRH